jgi:hypothetical protein
MCCFTVLIIVVIAKLQSFPLDVRHGKGMGLPNSKHGNQKITLPAGVHPPVVWKTNHSTHSCEAHRTTSARSSHDDQQALHGTGVCDDSARPPITVLGASFTKGFQTTYPYVRALCAGWAPISYFRACQAHIKGQQCWEVLLLCCNGHHSRSSCDLSHAPPLHAVTGM